MHGPSRARFPLLIFALLGACLLWGGCGDDSNPAKPAQPTPASGNVNKAPIVGATVTIHKINSDGSIDPAVVAGPFTTDAFGNWSGTIPAGQSGPFVMVSTGGTYTDEATGNSVTIPADRPLYGIYTSGACAVTPLTHATFLAMQRQVTLGATLSNAISQAIGSSTTAFGFSFTTTTPSDALAATTNQKKYAALLGGLSELIDANPAFTPTFDNTLPIDLVIAIARDMTDGKLDGLDASGAAIQVPTDPTGTTTAPLPALSATDLSAWITEANTYAALTPTLTGITFPTNVTWNPSNLGGGGGGGGSGSVGIQVITGSLTLPTNTITPDTSYVFAGTQLVWDDRVNELEITVVLADQNLYPGKVETVYVVYYGVTPSVVWNAFSISGVSGIALSGNTITFTNANIPELTSGGTAIRLNGSLTVPQ
jgi:hypothetical protein